MATKIPGGKPPEKIEPLLSDGQGVVAGVDEQLRAPAFDSDHQLQAPEVLDEGSIGRKKRPPGWAKSF